jgi:hypothetical protein
VCVAGALKKSARGRRAINSSAHSMASFSRSVRATDGDVSLCGSSFTKLFGRQWPKPCDTGLVSMYLRIDVGTGSNLPVVTSNCPSGLSHVVAALPRRGVGMPSCKECSV